MSLTSIQIADATRRKILEKTTTLVDDATLYMNMNLAYDDLKIKSFTNDQIESATIALTAGVGILPANFGTLYGPGYKTSTDKTPFEEKSIADFYRDQTVEGMTVEGGQLKVSPDTTAQMLIKFYPSYDALTSAQNPEINGYLHELIIYGAMYRILEDLQSESLAEYYKNVFKEEFKEKISSLSNYQEDNADGGTMFNYIRII
jgi:hypothetical protein